MCVCICVSFRVSRVMGEQRCMCVCVVFVCVCVSVCADLSTDISLKGAYELHRGAQLLLAISTYIFNNPILVQHVIFTLNISNSNMTR